MSVNASQKTRRGKLLQSSLVMLVFLVRENTRLCHIFDCSGVSRGTIRTLCMSCMGSMPISSCWRWLHTRHTFIFHENWSCLDASLRSNTSSGNWRVALPTSNGNSTNKSVRRVWSCWTIRERPFNESVSRFFGSIWRRNSLRRCRIYRFQPR